jgi:hypothetical protein
MNILIDCAAVRQCGSVQQCAAVRQRAAVRLVVYGSAHGSAVRLGGSAAVCGSVRQCVAVCGSAQGTSAWFPLLLESSVE